MTELTCYLISTRLKHGEGKFEWYFGRPLEESPLCFLLTMWKCEAMLFPTREDADAFRKQHGFKDTRIKKWRTTI